ncbi:MAG: translation elongation factor Ts [Pseudanabaenaceae cyanobacterium]
MTEVTPQQVQELRARTGAGIKDCKKALEETGGDFTKAIEYLRQKGLASAAKKAARATAEGIVHSYIHTDNQVGVLVEVNCETDFVARREELKELAEKVAKQIGDSPDAEINLLSQPFLEDPSITIDELVKQTAARLNENVRIRRFARYAVGREGKEVDFTNEKVVVAGADQEATGIVHSYIHFGSRVGVLVEINCATEAVASQSELKELADNVAKQIAACPNVEYVSVADIPQEIVAKEREIESGKEDLGNKPPAVRDKIVQGRVEKRLKEMSLLDQPFIKDQSITVDELVKQTGAKLKETLRVRRFVRYVVGE